MYEICVWNFYASRYDIQFKSFELVELYASWYTAVSFTKMIVTDAVTPTLWELANRGYESIWKSKLVIVKERLKRA